MKTVGNLLEEKTAEIYSLFEPVEGFNYVYYGKIRNGKTYSASADIIELLERGEIVYANWNIDFTGYDERQSFGIALMKLLFGKKYFYHFKKENFHYLDQNDPKFVETLNRLVGVHLFIDEGQWIFNSHLKSDDVEKRKLVLEGGHYCRSLRVITQRPANILKDIRSQVHVWYKVEKVLHWGGIIRFVRYEYQNMKEDLPDEEEYQSKKAYWGKERIFNAYNTHGRRAENAIVEPPVFDVYETSFLDHLSLVAKHMPFYEAFTAVTERLRRPSREASKTLKQPKWAVKDIKGR